MKSKPICFIGMAFGKEDTNKLYEKQIEPVLKKNNITPVIINRQEKNDDLNIQIIRQLKSCDFAIMDLTYARQSVYYEAGFAEREVEVIYTVRQDHLVNGNTEDRRVHFDLTMKPLIVWQDIHDKTFQTRLNRRLNATVLKKWRIEKTENEKLIKSKNEFEVLAQNEKLQFIRKTAIKILATYGFRNWKFWPRYRRRDSKITQSNLRKGEYEFLVSVLTKKSCLELVTINSYSSATKSELKPMANYYQSGYLNELIPAKFVKNIEFIVLHNLVFSIRNIPDSRIQDTFPAYRKIRNTTYNKFELSGGYWYHIENDKDITLMRFLHFISGIDSEIAINTRIQDLYEEFFKNQSDMF